MRDDVEGEDADERRHTGEAEQEDPLQDADVFGEQSREHAAILLGVAASRAADGCRGRVAACGSAY